MFVAVVLQNPISPTGVDNVRSHSVQSGFLQQTADSKRGPAPSLASDHQRQNTGTLERHPSYPTDAKVTEKGQRERDKEVGIERPVKKKSRCRDHDDCGEDLASLDEQRSEAF